MRTARPEYYRELARFTKQRLLVTPLFLAIANSGGSTAHDVRVQISIPDADTGVVVMDADDYPDPPQSETSVLHFNVERLGRREVDVKVSRLQERWLVEAKAEKVQPRSIAYFRNPLYLGAATSQELAFELQIFSDSLAHPHRQLFSIPVATAKETVDLTRIIALENERITSSPEHQRLLRELGAAE